MATRSDPARVETFAALQERLPGLWKSIQDIPGFRHVTVVVPSLSLDSEELSKIEGVPFYEERLLFILMRLRNPSARLLYVTSEPVPAEIVDYYLQLLVGVPASHARARLKLLCLYDSSPRALTEKILERPRVLARMRDWIGDPGRAYLTVFNSSPLERELAVELGIPMNGVDPDLLEWGTKSGSREIFRRAGAALPAGFENLHGRAEVVARLGELARERPDIRRAVIKLNSSFSGQGNAVFEYPPELTEGALDGALEKVRWSSEHERLDSYLDKMRRQGGIVEEHLEAKELRSPSVQMRITPTREVLVVSTHDQVLGGGTGHAYLGCRFPADEAYRALIEEEGRRIAEVLRELGVISRFGVDFIAWQDGKGGWRLAAIEINLRMTGTTFPFLALEFLTGGRLSPEDGMFRSSRGQAKFYVATDNLKSPRYRGLLPEDLIDLAIADDLFFDPVTETGVLFHMIGALSEHGKLGLIAIGDSIEHARLLFDETVSDLDRQGTHEHTRSDRDLPVLRID